MTLIKSISGIRGTLGGKLKESLTPIDIAGFAAAFAMLLRMNSSNGRLKVVIGRDARPSGGFISQIVAGTLMSCGVDVVDLGLTTTPTVELAVVDHQADGGIIITASHNPGEWNALKFVQHEGEFISAEEGQTLIRIAESSDFVFSGVGTLGTHVFDESQLDKHILKILSHPLVDLSSIRKAGIKVAVDSVNSSGGIAIPRLLYALGVSEVFPIYCEPDGLFRHNPEPLPENLGELSKLVMDKKADLGFAVDPDVDRLAIVSENGEMFGEEYTLVAVADYVLKSRLGPSVSNLSSTRALKDVTEGYGQNYFASAVGEVNVVARMKEVNAVIGGEGNGGIILPDFHYGRDALMGIALFLSHFARSGMTCSEMKANYPQYAMSKNKIMLPEGVNVTEILNTIEKRYQEFPCNNADGLKIDFEKEWIHLRQSNTEPVIRIYTESNSPEAAEILAMRFIDEIKQLI